MPINILVVEDDAELKALITYKFRERTQSGELAFRFAGNGREALDMLAASPEIALVLSDIDMPEMDGLTLLSHLQEQYPLIRAIMITGYRDMRTIRAAMNRGAYDFLSKPFDFADLETTLNKGIREAQRLRREAEERQQEQQTLLELQRALETIPVGVTVVNLDGQIIYTNPADARMHGYKVEELIGQDVGVLTQPELRHRVRLEDVKKWQGFVRESVNRRRDGQTFPVWLMSEIVKGADGTPQAIVTTCEDIADRKRLEQESKRAYERYMLAASAGKTGIWEYDLTSQILFSDQMLKRIYGYEPHELEDSEMSWRQRIHPDDLPRFEGRLAEQLMNAGDETLLELRIVRKDQSIGWVEVTSSVVRDADGQPVRFVGTTVDITARKQAEEALRQLNQELEQRVTERTAELTDLYDNAPCGYHSLNPDGLILRMNQTELDWLGYARDEVIGRKRFPEMLTPESQHTFFTNFPRFKQQGFVTNREFDMVRKDGTIFSALVNGTALYDEQGQFLMSRCTAVDHTDRKRIQLALEESEQNFHAFFDTIDYLLFVLDAQGIILRVNTAVCRSLEYHENDLIGMNVLELHPRERREEAAAIVAAMAAGRTDACPVPLVTQSGRIIPVETRVFKGSWSGQPVLFGITKDISALQASEEKFAKVFYTNPTPMALSELDNGRFIDVNDAFIETTGYTRFEVIGHTSAELNLFAESAQRTNALQDIALSGSVQNLEVTARSKSGEIRHGLFSADLLYLQDRQVLLTVMVDVTERKQAEAELARARDAANAANRAKSEFLANMSHELRTPLNAILGYAQILQKADNLSERQREGVRTIRESGEYLLQLITDILDMSKIEAGRMELQPQEFHLADVLNRLSQMIQVRAEQKQLEFLYTADADLPDYVMTDERKLRQVLLNLLGNAVKFTDRGRVTLRVTKLNAPLLEKSDELPLAPGRNGFLHDAAVNSPPGRGWGWVADSDDGVLIKNPPLPLPGGESVASIATEKPITVRGEDALPAKDYAAQPPTAWLCFEVIDTGIGMMEEDLSTLFVPFRQIGERRAALEGTGLGLAISAKLVALMGGTIRVASAIGQGSRFWFDLPVRVVESPSIAGAASHAEIVGYIGTIRTILVVDDKPANLAILANMLEPLGFNILKATSGQAGLQLALTQRPDMILLDLRMPEIDGFEVARRLRADPVGQELTVIAVSASVQSDIRQQSLNAGCNDFLEKPVIQEDLCALLGKYLGLTWMYAQLEGTIPTQTPNAADLANLRRALPPDLLAALLAAAERGDIRAVARLIDQLAERDRQFAPFVEQLRQLAKNFQVDEIANILRDLES